MTFDPIGVHVGGRIRTRRAELGISTQQIADALATTVEHVERMEDGTMRMSGYHILRLALELRVAPTYFFSTLGTGPR